MDHSRDSRGNLIAYIHRPFVSRRSLSRLNNFFRPTTLPYLLETRDQIRRRVSRLQLPQRNGDNASLARIRSRGFLSWKEPAVLAAAVMEEEECEDGNNRPASGRKRSREKPLRGSLRGCTMLLRYRRDVAVARTSNQYGAIGCQVLTRVAATCHAAITNDPRR